MLLIAQWTCKFLKWGDPTISLILHLNSWMSDYIIARNRYGSIEDFVFIFWIWHCRCRSKVGFLWVMEGKFLNTPFLSANWLQFVAEQSGLCTKIQWFFVKFNHECRFNLSFLANQHQVSLETHIELALSREWEGSSSLKGRFLLYWT